MQSTCKFSAVGAIVTNVERVRERIHGVLARLGRPDSSVAIVAVTKSFGPEVVREIVEAGIVDIGENRVQELVAKADEVDLECRWHLVGPLQRNKATKAVGGVHLFHAIDGVRIAQTIDRLARERGTVERVLLEVNTSGEASKHGFAPADVRRAAGAIRALDHVELVGLMTIGPASFDPAETRSCFRSLAGLAESLRCETGLPLPHLSMGMSADFEIALEEGATLLRLGRVLTGERVVR